jgi:hypothetical protein
MQNTVTIWGGLRVTYKRGSGLDDGFIAPYIHTTWEYSAIAILHTIQFTGIHTLEFSVFLATDL